MPRRSPTPRRIASRERRLPQASGLRWSPRMPITSTPEQQAWIDDHVASGDYASVEDAARRLLDAAILDHALHGDDLAWAKPLVDEALAAVERGEVMSWEERRARNKARLASPSNE